MPKCRDESTAVEKKAAGRAMVSWDPSQQEVPGSGIRAHMPHVALSTPLPLRRDVEERITSLGPVCQAGAHRLKQCCMRLTHS